MLVPHHLWDILPRMNLQLWGTLNKGFQRKLRAEEMDFGKDGKFIAKITKPFN